MGWPICGPEEDAVEDAVETLVELAESSPDEVVRLRAAQEIIRRTDGRP